MNYKEAWEEAQIIMPQATIKQLKELTESILKQEKELEKEEWDEEHEKYIKSDRWLNLRKSVLMRDNYICKICKNRANQVHHEDYRYVNTENEFRTCISLCKECHSKIHNK